MRYEDSKDNYDYNDDKRWRRVSTNKKVMTELIYVAALQTLLFLI
jgi:hypothetical protein